MLFEDRVAEWVQKSQEVQERRSSQFFEHVKQISIVQIRWSRMRSTQQSSHGSQLSLKALAESLGLCLKKVIMDWRWIVQFVHHGTLLIYTFPERSASQWKEVEDGPDCYPSVSQMSEP